MKNMKLFVPITKVDEAKRTVYGRATQEVPDKANEIFDYETSVPYFKKWSEEVYKDSDGKSMGNVRSMHSKIAAGKVTSIDYNDAEKAIDVSVKIVDNNEWEKVLEGVHTGFSIGGAYVGKKWADPTDPTLSRFTANPAEISIVDRPCCPTAKFFEVCKVDGSSEQREFKTYEDEPEVEKVAARDEVKPEEGKDKYGDVAFADTKNKKYPIDTEEHIRAAWNYINQPKNADEYSTEDVKTIKDKILAAWKEKIDKDGPPSAQEKAMETEDLNKAGYFSADKVAGLDAKHKACCDAHEALGKCLDDMKGSWKSNNANAAEGEKAVADEMNKAQESLSKIAELETSLAKAESDLAKANETVAELQKRVTELEAQPEPAKGVVTVVAEKTNESTLNARSETLEEEMKKVTLIEDPTLRAQKLIETIYRHSGGK